MSRIIPCRIAGYDELNATDGTHCYYVALPDMWTGRHTVIEEQAAKAGTDERLNGMQLTFAVSLALADDYRLPGLESKEWDFSALPLKVIAWVNAAVYGSYKADMLVSKNFLEPLPPG